MNMDKRMREFNQCLSDASLDDLNYRDTTFTWWNKRKLAPIAKKLDRCLVNVEWYNMFPSSVAFVGSPDFSDHAAITVSLDPSRIRTKKPFRFYNFILQNSDFIATVCVSWFSFNITGSAMYRAAMKLKMLKNVIRDFSKQNYTGIEKKNGSSTREAPAGARSDAIFSFSIQHLSRAFCAERLGRTVICGSQLLLSEVADNLDFIGGW